MRHAAVVAALITLGLPRAAPGQSPPKVPARCGERFAPAYVYTNVCWVARRYPERRHRAADANAGALCAARVGGSCTRAVRLSTDTASTCSGKGSGGTCTCPVANTYRCVDPARTPDFAVSALDARVSGRDLELAIDVCNLGPVPGTAEVGLYAGRIPPAAGCPAPDDGLVGEARVTLPPGVGGCAGARVAFRDLPAGTYRFSVKADHRCRVGELDEVNNRRYRSVVVGARLVDLYPRVTARALGGGKVRYELALCRSGIPTRPVGVRVFLKEAGARVSRSPCSAGVSGADLLAEERVALPAGCTAVAVTADRPVGSAEQICVALDSGCDLVESDRLNNVACATYTAR